jgi:hypothetical protein
MQAGKNRRRAAPSGPWQADRSGISHVTRMGPNATLTQIVSAKLGNGDVCHNENRVCIRVCLQAYRGTALLTATSGAAAVRSCVALYGKLQRLKPGTIARLVAPLKRCPDTNRLLASSRARQIESRKPEAGGRKPAAVQTSHKSAAFCSEASGSPVGTNSCAT